MDENSYYIILVIAGIIIVFLTYLLIRFAVSGGVKKSNRIIISLLYKIAEKNGVHESDLSDINQKISDLDNSPT
jgi:high-affinity Fe2+/Pb2+ permease